MALSGPSGVGKDAVLDRMKNSRRRMSFAVTATTRRRRSGEVDGVDYHFLSKERFERMRDRGELLEWAEVYGNYYGVPRQQVDRALRDGRDIMVKVDVQGAMTIKRVMPQAISIFLVAPSMEELQGRLRNRKTESDSDMQRRTATAAEEMKKIDDFDYVVVNDTVEQAVSEIERIISAEKERETTSRGKT